MAIYDVNGYETNSWTEALDRLRAVRNTAREKAAPANAKTRADYKKLPPKARRGHRIYEPSDSNPDDQPEAKAARNEPIKPLNGGRKMAHEDGAAEEFAART